MKKCEICGENGWHSKKFNLILCPKHYYHYKKYGKVIKTKYEKNEIEIIEDCVLIKCTDLESNCCKSLIIDKEDYDKIKDIRWRLDKKGYGFNNSNKNIYIHNIIMNPKDDEIVDHKDGNPLNNRKSNLRIVSNHENCLNHKVKSTNTSGVTGVTKGIRKKWRARINFNREIHIGEYDNFIDAVKNRLLYESILFQSNSRYYNEETKSLVLFFLDKDTNKDMFIEIKTLNDEDAINLQSEEISYEELKNIKSERGMTCLGQSGK